MSIERVYFNTPSSPAVFLSRMTSHSGESVDANISVAGFRFKERISMWVGCSAEMVTVSTCVTE